MTQSKIADLLSQEYIRPGNAYHFTLPSLNITRVIIFTANIANKYMWVTLTSLVS